MMKSVGVCVATYNGACYISEQLDSIIASILSAGVKNWHIYLSDDGSTDKTLKILSSYVSENISVLNGPGKGPAKNFEFLLSQVNEDCIFLSDQDDIWLESRVKTSLNALSYCDVHVCNASLVDQNLISLGLNLRDIYKTPKSLIAVLIKNSFTGACMSMNVSVLKDIDPSPPGVMHDWWIGLNAILCSKKIIFGDEVLLLYRRHSATVTQPNASLNFTLTALISRLRIIRFLFFFFIKTINK